MSSAVITVTFAGRVKGSTGASGNRVLETTTSGSVSETGSAARPMRGQTTSRHEQDNPVTADNRDMTQPPLCSKGSSIWPTTGFPDLRVVVLPAPSQPPTLTLPLEGEGWEGGT